MFMFPLKNLARKWLMWMQLVMHVMALMLALEISVDEKTLLVDDVIIQVEDKETLEASHHRLCAL